MTKHEIAAFRAGLHQAADMSPACAGTGWATHEDRHAETGPDRCRPCQGTGQIASHTGETREGSFDPETGHAFGEPVTTTTNEDSRCL